MADSSTGGSYVIEWRPEGGEDVDLVLALSADNRADARLLAAAGPGSTVFRVSAHDGREVVTNGAALLEWADSASLPPAAGNWTSLRPGRSQAVHADVLLESLLAWSRSKGLLDEIACRRLTLALQMEMAGEPYGQRS